jgi:hypothetical protein
MHGNTDVLWRQDASGIAQFWTMNNGSVQGATNSGQTLGWNVVATGDLNRDDAATWSG